MKIRYYDLPFGAQLLLWTSRILINGSCRTNPNKYKLVDIAYQKVGIANGAKLLKAVLLFLKSNESFRVQSICNQILIEDEINLINCIDKNKNNNFNNYHFIKIWSIKEKKKDFTLAVKKLADTYEKYNLAANLNDLIYVLKLLTYFRCIFHRF